MSDCRDDLIDREWFAKRLGVKPRTVTNWVSANKAGFPKGFKLGTSQTSPRRWRRGVAEDYINSLEQAA